MEYPSKLVAQAVEEIAKLPGIGRKTALRLVLHLLKQPESFTSNIATAIRDLREQVTYCSTCHIIADTSDCTCQGMTTDTSVICVVEDTPDALAVRATGQYRGMFHVLGGRISPVDGIGPEDIYIDSLVRRLKPPTEVQEVILALSSTMEGDTTAYYITKQLQDMNVKITTIARGIPIGGELEYADELTLGKSIAARTL
ncbi:MAG: recombination mediator RecR, partial [Bacteroidota bacterium]